MFSRCKSPVTSKENDPRELEKHKNTTPKEEANFRKQKEAVCSFPFQKEEKTICSFLASFPSFPLSLAGHDGYYGPINHAGWWSQPLPKMVVNLEVLPKVGMEVKKDMTSHHPHTSAHQVFGQTSEENDAISQTRGVDAKRRTSQNN